VLVLLPLDVRLLAPVSVLRVAVPWLHGPVHDWLVIPGWLHEQMHAEGVEHRHHPDDTTPPPPSRLGDGAVPSATSNQGGPA
jgi:hypothetical protein